MKPLVDNASSGEIIGIYLRGQFPCVNPANNMRARGPTSDLFCYFESLPVNDDLLGPIFPSLYGKPSGSHGGLSNAFHRLMSLARIRSPLGKEKTGKGRQFRALGFHSLRHSFISKLGNADVPSDVRKQIVGHSSDDIHRRYLHLDLSLQERAQAKLLSVL